MAEIDFTFGGQLKWVIEPQCFDTDVEAGNIQRELEASRETWTPLEKQTLVELSILLSCTRTVEMVGDKRPSKAVLQFVEVINNRPSPAELVAWRFKLPYKLRDAWDSAWSAGQDMFTNIDPAQLPTANLTLAQQEALQDKNSPLAVTA